MEANESLDVFLLFTKLNPVNNNTTLQVIYFGQSQPDARCSDVNSKLDVNWDCPVCPCHD